MSPIPEDVITVYSEYSAIRSDITAAKYRGATRRLVPLTQAACPGVSGWGGVNAVTWVPTIPRRWRLSGEDHARVIARTVSRWFGLPLVSTLIRVDKIQQVARSREERLHGPRFRVRPGMFLPRRVLLVDDVITTGSTIAAAQRELIAHGARAIPVFALAGSRRFAPQQYRRILRRH